jgi:triphosphatase
MNQKGFMEYEIELKLLTNQQAGDVIETQLLPQLNASITQQTQILTNHYFDTPSRTLRQHDIGLRIRGNDQQFEQTLKTAGKSIGGLQQRPEYNIQLSVHKNQSGLLLPPEPKPEPDLKLFPPSAWPKTIDVGDLQARIKTLFSTHFERKVYLLEFPHGDIVELVWDSGEVTSGNKSVPICEIELELKKGSTTALFDLARHIVSLMPATIGTDSKAARGYNLLDNSLVKEVKQQQNSSGNLNTDAESFVSSLTALLQDFQRFSAEIRREYSIDLVTNIRQVLAVLVNHLAQFTRYFPCQSLEYIHMQLKTLDNDWCSVTPQNDKAEVYNLLVKAQTTQLQLDIVQCLVDQPWSSEV